MNVGQWIDIQSPRVQQFQKILEVSMLGPPDIPVRIIAPVYFILRIVSSRPVRTGNTQFQLFAIHFISAQPEAHITDHGNPTPLTAHFKRQVDRFIAFRCRTHDHTIQANTIRYGRDIADTVGGIQPPRGNAIHLVCKRHTFRGKVRAKNLIPHGVQDSDTQLSD